MSSNEVNKVIEGMLINNNLWNLIDFGSVYGNKKSDSDQIISLDSDEETREYDYDGKLEEDKIEEAPSAASSNDPQKSAQTSLSEDPDQAKGCSKKPRKRRRRLRGDEETPEANEKGIASIGNLGIVIMNEQRKCKLNLTDENIHAHMTTRYGYQIYYEGKAIDKATFNSIVSEKRLRTDTDWFLCRLHDDCAYSKPNSSQSRKLFNDGSLDHARDSLNAIYLCRLCLRTYCTYENLKCHLRRHSARETTPVKKKNHISSSWVQTIGDYSDTTLMDYQGTHKLNITDEKIFSHPKTNCEYQIYYEGRVIDKDELRKNLVEKALKTKPGWFICPVHDDCVYKEAQADPKIQRKGQFNQVSLRHYESAFATYLCRTCYRRFGGSMEIISHFRVHSRK